MKEYLNKHNIRKTNFMQHQVKVKVQAEAVRRCLVEMMMIMMLETVCLQLNHTLYYCSFKMIFV